MPEMAKSLEGSNWAEDPPFLRIRATGGRILPRLWEAWDHRELLYFLTWRDIKVRYKQTALGAAWAVLQPTLTMVLFATIFGRLARVPSDNIPYPVFAFCGLLPWQLFAYALTSSANSLVSNEQLVTKAYFPRLILPISSVLAGLVDFAIAFCVLLLLMAFYGIMPTGAVVFLPFFVALAIVTAITVGLGLSALNVRFRDVRHALPFLTQIWLFATPIAYPSSLVPERFRVLFGLNPMVGVVEGFRWALLGAPAPGAMLLASIVVVVFGFFLAMTYFMRVERSFADVL
jgi:lipopolysaccharide transport system permease protein